MAHPAGGPTKIGQPETVADLSGLDRPREMRAHRVALSAVQGFLALHQAGGFVALVRPFDRSANGLAYSHREPESRTTVSPAYAPTILHEGRFLLLADRGVASVIDLWDTDISAASRTGQKPKRFNPPGPIATPPIALSESKIGMVIGERAPYSWIVWNLDAAELSPAEMRTTLKPLKLTGGPCEASLVGGATLAFATPEGHWAWRLADALAGEVDAIKPTWLADSANDGVWVQINRQVENSEAFANPGQVFLSNQPGGPFYWIFRTSDGRARSYRVTPADLKTDDRSDYEGTSPVGLAVRPGQSRPSMIFDKGDELFEERDIRGKLAPCQITLPREGRASLQLVGRLIVTIGNTREGTRSIQVQSLWGGPSPIRTEEISGLASDPFVWSGHLFTVERPRDDRLALVRRALIAPSEVKK